MFLESATIALGGKLPLGELGQLLPALAKKYDLRDAVFLAELNLDQLLARRNPVKSFKPLPQFPSIRRDVAMLVPEATTHEAVLQTVKQTKPAELGSRGIVRRVPRQACAGRPKEPGLCLHLSRGGQNFDGCGRKFCARKSFGDAEDEVAGGIARVAADDFKLATLRQRLRFDLERGDAFDFAHFEPD